MVNYELQKKKILIISVTAGGGHIKAAQNLIETVSTSFHNTEIEYIDFFQYLSPVFKFFYGESYLFLIKYMSFLYGKIYDGTDVKNCSKIKKGLNNVRLKIQGCFAIKLKRKIIEFDPDYIIFTHPLPAEYFCRYNFFKNTKTKYAVIITDFYAHQLWYQKNIYLYFVANEELKKALIEHGIEKKKVHITGIPVSDKFSKDLNKESVRILLGLKPEVTTILVMSGAHGVGKIYKLLEYLLNNIDREFQVFALTGSNNRLFKKVKKLEGIYSNRLKVVKFTDEVYKYMAASDFIITKAGGLTISECLCYGLPVITLNPIPGQEKRNIDYFVKKAVGLKVYDFNSLKKNVISLLDDEKLLNKMQADSKKLSKSNAGNEILKILLEGL
ncbi:MAG: glycosyltransferase [bacterium]|nr:glycosyltransferase [bacterium]